MNRSKQTFPQGVELKHTVDLLPKIGTRSTVDDISVLTGDRLLIRIARWASHSCDPNCEYYMSNGFKGRTAVRLRTLRQIKPNEEMTIFYENDAFGPGNRFCLCPHTAKHENTDQELESSRTYILCRKKEAVQRPRIKFQDSNFLQSELTDLLYFYDESSNISGTSDPADCTEENTQHNSGIQQSFSEIVQGNRLEVCESTTERDSDNDSEGELVFFFLF